MSQPRPSAFRDALQVSQERIAALGDSDLNRLMAQLFRAQAYKTGLPPGRAFVNTQGNAKDDGSDGWSGRPSKADAWFSDSDTCWQFKAGTAGEPARLAGEVAKKIPSETLRAGGRFVVVCSGSTNGKKGLDDRLDVLKREASDAGIPAARIEVLGSEQLAIWCNEYPAVAARWAGRPSGLWALEEWTNADEHRVPWQSSPSVQAEIDARRKDLDPAGGSIHHLHIQGPPGVGKTRFALELCRDASWSSLVLYVRQASDLRLVELIDGSAGDPGVQLVAVVDEAQVDQLRLLRDSVERGDGRVRLVTIGHGDSPDPSRIPVHLVKPLDWQATARVVRGWYPAMPPEHVDFIAQFADGYIRLAKLAADAVAHNPTMDVTDLLSRSDIKTLMDRMLDTDDRRPLYVVAVLANVGWAEDKEAEGKAIASSFGLDWNDVRYKVDAFHGRFGIAPRGGRYRYISPTPLGIYLAVEAWNTFPDLLKALPNVLPSADARDAYNQRLRSMASNVHAREFARTGLDFFFSLDRFLDVYEVRRWAALAAADPAKASRGVLAALANAGIEERKRIEGGARRELVWTLVRLAWKASCFHDAVIALALLAEAENETWANNASAEFVAKFDVGLGGTAVPYTERLKTLDEVLSIGRTSLTRFAIRALGRIHENGAWRSELGPISDEPPEPEWRPANGREYLECIELAFARLTTIAKAGAPDLEVDLVKVASDIAMLLREGPARRFVAEFFDSVRASYPNTRETLRQSVFDILHREKKYWKQLSAEELTEIESIHRRFEDASLGARLRQHVGRGSFDRDEPADLLGLASELIADKDCLSVEWPWLTSGEAADSWELGEALATADATGELASLLPTLRDRGHDLRVLSGYVSWLGKQRGPDWIDAWLKGQMTRNPSDSHLLFEIAWRCGPTVASAMLVTAALREHDVEPHFVGQLAYGRWGEDLPIAILLEVLRAMAERGHGQTAIAILEHRMKKVPSEYAEWDALALGLVTSRELIRSGQMAGHYWKEIAALLVPGHARVIASAIFREQADRTDKNSPTWFAEHSEANSILCQCVKADPAGVWAELRPFLLSFLEAYSFTVGFPEGLLENLPSDSVGAWIAEKAEERASLAARLIVVDFSSDSTMAAQLVGTYGDNEHVGSAFFSAIVSGTWVGPISERWAGLASHMADVAKRTSLPKLCRWAEDAATSLRGMAKRDRQREEERDLRR